MRRDLGVIILAACPAFAQSAPAKLVTLDIAAVGTHGQAIPDLRSSEIEIFDNKKAQSIVYWHSNQRRPDIPHVTVILFSLEKAGIKSVAWNEAIGAMRRFEASDYLYFYAVTDRGVLLPVHALPKPDADSPPENAPWMDQRLPQFESANNLRRPPWDMDYSTHNGASLTYAQYATLNYAQDIAARLAAFPGRKNLICIGCLLSDASSWHANNPEAPPATLATELRQLAGAFHQARVAVYPIGGQKRRYLASQVGESLDLIRIDQIDAFARALEAGLTRTVKSSRPSHKRLTTGAPVTGSATFPLRTIGMERRTKSGLFPPVPAFARWLPVGTLPICSKTSSGNGSLLSQISSSLARLTNPTLPFQSRSRRRSRIRYVFGLASMPPIYCSSPMTVAIPEA
jgi:hypothetical protein